jgi:hypothetical protein
MATVRVISGGWPPGPGPTQGKIAQLMEARVRAALPDHELQFAYAKGMLSRLEEYMTNVAGVDVILTIDTRAHRFLRDTAAADPVPGVTPAVVMASTTRKLFEMARQGGGRLTGIQQPELADAVKQQLSLLKDFSPELKRVWVLHYANQSESGAAAQKLAIVHKVAIDEVGILDGVAGEIKLGQKSDEGWRAAVQEIEDGFDDEAFKGRAAADEDEGLIALPSTPVSLYRRRIVRKVDQYKVKAVYPFTAFVGVGGLLSWGVNKEWALAEALKLVQHLVGPYPRRPSDLGIITPPRGDDDGGHSGIASSAGSISSAITPLNGNGRGGAGAFEKAINETSAREQIPTGRLQQFGGQFPGFVVFRHKPADLLDLD